MTDQIFQALASEVSQGDIVEVAPHIWLDPPLRLIRPTLQRAGHYHETSDVGVDAAHAVSGCKRALAMIISYDCDIENKPKWVICPVLSLSEIGDKGQQGHAKKNRISDFFFIPRHAADFPDSVVVLSQITTIHGDLIRGIRRIATLSDHGRQGLYAQFIRWLSRWQFTEITCPNCEAAFDATLGLRVRPPN